MADFQYARWDVTFTPMRFLGGHRIRRIILFTTAAKDMSETDLNDMYEFASKNSAKNNLSGVSLYFKRNFCHIREGDSQAIARSVVRTEQSPWHYNISIVSDDTVSSRILSGYTLAFQALGHAFETSGIIPLEQVFDHPDMQKLMQDLTCRSFVEAFLQDMSSDP